MTGRSWFGLLLVGVSGCVTVQTRSSDTLSADGVRIVQADTERGDLSYTGGANRADFNLAIRDWANAGGKRKATARQASNGFEYGVDGEVFTLFAVSGHPRAGVDFDLTGPRVMHLDMITGSGSVRLANVDGSHVVTGNYIQARDLVGDADFFSNHGGMDVEIFPYPQDGRVTLESASGGVVVYLPRGLEYDLNVFSDPEHEMEIEDLGFDRLVLDAGVAVGLAGRRTVQVDIFVTGGPTRIYAAR